MSGRRGRAARGVVVAACATAIASAAVPGAGAAEIAGPTWYVRAGVARGGDGSIRDPFSSLARVEAASDAGDRIVVLRAAASAAPLGGGIRLKPHQRLIGAGPSVRRLTAADAAPRITNTDPARLDGDAVRVADGSTVRNLAVRGSLRGGIYGTDVRGVRIVGNDVSAHNASCTPGFHIPPFNVPTLLGGLGIPIGEGLHNGWAGIMVDADRGRAGVTIAGNRVHDAECGDGIDIRASGSSVVRASVRANVVQDLRQGESLESILAIGLQTSDHARMVAHLDRNRQHGLGNDEDLGIGPTGADSEGVFVNPTGPSRMRVGVRRNTYSHTLGRGGFSANGLEFVSMGNGSRATLTVRDSHFSGTPGDVLEQLALGTGAHLRMRLRRVTATASTGFGGSGVGDTLVIPGNNADCLVAASGGAGNAVELRVRESALTDCANNGLTLGSDVANGSGPSAELSLELADSEVTGNHGGNLRIGNLTGLDRLDVMVERTDLSNSRGTSSTPANLTVEELGNTREAMIDLGGGPLGSTGGVCLDGGLLSAAIVGYDVHAERAWWGTPAGPAPGRVLALGGALNASEPLQGPPASC